MTKKKSFYDTGTWNVALTEKSTEKDKVLIGLMYLKKEPYGTQNNEAQYNRSQHNSI